MTGYNTWHLQKLFICEWGCIGIVTLKSSTLIDGYVGLMISVETCSDCARKDVCDGNNNISIENLRSVGKWLLSYQQNACITVSTWISHFRMRTFYVENSSVRTLFHIEFSFLKSMCNLTLRSAIILDLSSNNIVTCKSRVKLFSILQLQRCPCLSISSVLRWC